MTGVLPKTLRNSLVLLSLRLAQAVEGSTLEIEFEFVPFESYIVKINMDKSKENWDDPASYLSTITSSLVVRQWIVDDNMYVVVNIPIVEE